MHKNSDKIHFSVHFSEPIVISQKRFSLKLLSTHDFIVFVQRYGKLLKYLSSISGACGIYKSIAEKACLVSMCLYKNSNVKVFSSPMEVLKNLTPIELKYIYNRYIKLSSQALKHHIKTVQIFENVKKHRYQKDFLEK